MPNKKREAIVPQESAEPGEFVGKYLDLGDMASGFERQITAGNRLTISICKRCRHVAATRDLRLLALVESLHVCPGDKR